MLQVNSPLFTNVSMGSTVHSDPIPIRSEPLYAIQLYWTAGSPVGNFTIEVSCDPFSSTNNIVVGAPTHWTTLANSSSAAGGAAGDLLYNVNLASYNWFRVTYTRSSDTGTLNGRYNLKGV